LVDQLAKPNYRRAEHEAARLLKEFSIESPPINPVAIARDMGLNVYFVKLTGPSNGISGFYDGDEDCIFVNKEEFPLRQTWTVAHELGHKILHEEWAKSADYKVLMRNSTEEKDFREKESDAFAANLLMPRFMMDQYWDTISVEELSRLFAVSVPAVKNRLSFLYGV